MAAGNLPDVIQLVLCESAAHDASIGSWVLVRPYTRIHLAVNELFPTVLNRLALYYQLADAFGTFQIQVEVVSPGDAATQPTALRTSAQTVQFPTDRTVIDDAIYLSNIPLLEPGEYEFRLLANGQRLRRSLFVTIGIGGQK